MAQPARPLSPVPESAIRRDRLRTVDAPVARPRRPQPSAAVIRRRRAVALGGLAGLIGLPLAVLAIGGAPASEAGRVTALLAAGASSPRTLCDQLSPAMLALAGGRAACRASSPERGPKASVHDVQVHGARATAIVTSTDGDETYSLVKRDGDWKVDAVR